jgi:hypothetical protein
MKAYGESQDRPADEGGESGGDGTMRGDGGYVKRKY